MCLGGGVPCHVFSECCSGTCANNVCAKCASAEEKCADGCCVGLTCYDGKCGACKDDGQPCVAFADCCSGVCTSGFCAPLICDVGMNACGNKCVEPLDHDNCLSCSNKCATGAECCQSGCVDTANDASNCGACNVHCAWYKECKIGVCSNSPSCCNDGPNASHSPAEGDLIQPHGELVWPFTPSCNMKVKQIGVFTIGGWVGLAEDVQGKPGKELGGSQLVDGVAASWLFGKFDFNLVAGQQYWIVHDDTDNQFARASIAPGGALLPTYSSMIPNGPYTKVADWPMTAKLIGDCP